MFLRALVFDNYLAGTYNAVSPNPETNAEFMRLLRRALYRPWSPPVPAWLVRLSCKITGSEPSLALEGCRCAPKRFMESGFEYKFPDLREALKSLCQ
jgi:NAD dependent epimerase/dehydratase family enzyme